MTAKDLEARRLEDEAAIARARELQQLPLAPDVAFSSFDDLKSCSDAEAPICAVLNEKYPTKDFKVSTLPTLLLISSWNTDLAQRAQVLCKSENITCAVKDEAFVTFLLFVYQNFSGQAQLFQAEQSYNFAFLQEEAGKKVLRFVVAIKGNRLLNILEVMDEGQIKNLFRVGPVAATFAKDFTLIQQSSSYPPLPAPTPVETPAPDESQIPAPDIPTDQGTTVPPE